MLHDALVNNGLQYKFEKEMKDKQCWTFYCEPDISHSDRKVLIIIFFSDSFAKCNYWFENKMCYIPHLMSFLLIYFDVSMTWYIVKWEGIDVILSTIFIKYPCASHRVLILKWTLGCFWCNYWQRNCSMVT